WESAKANVAHTISPEVRSGLMISSVMSLMVDDFVRHTDALIAQSGVRTVDDVYKTREPLVGFSPAVLPAARELKDFLYENFYYSSMVLEYNKKGRGAIRSLFKKIMADPSLLPAKFQARRETEALPIVVKDYIAGMTDPYALELYKRLK
ncbi:MAG: hypothetical protein V1760_03450, partial [Candidatus Peregrinibacteria bacterium]